MRSKQERFGNLARVDAVYVGKKDKVLGKGVRNIEDLVVFTFFYNGAISLEFPY